MAKSRALIAYSKTPTYHRPRNLIAIAYLLEEPEIAHTRYYIHPWNLI